MAKHASDGSNNPRAIHSHAKNSAHVSKKVETTVDVTEAFDPVSDDLVEEDETEIIETPENDGKIQTIGIIDDSSTVDPDPAEKEVIEDEEDMANKGFFARIFAKPSTSILFVLVILCIVGVIACLGYVVWTSIESGKVAARDYGLNDSLSVSEITDRVANEEYVDNPIDFATLQAENPDVIAWITVPGTEVNLPILRNEEDTDYYLRHDINGAYSIGGELYVQNANAADFSDPVTVIYGHTFSFNDTMFSTLHQYEDKTFFDEHPTFTIYTPDHVLTYEVCSAYEYTNELIIGAHNFGDPAERAAYMESVLNPDPANTVNNHINVRSTSEIDVEDGKIVQLSTCTVPSTKTNRYLVNGVLIEEKKAIPYSSAVSDKPADATNTNTNAANTNNKAA